MGFLCGISWLWGWCTSAMSSESSEGIFSLEEEDFGAFKALDLSFDLVAVFGREVVELEFVFVRHLGGGDSWYRSVRAGGED